MPSTDRVLDDSQLEKLTEFINDNFRVHPNHDPVYVDVGGNLKRIRAPQHQVVYGRRGSGKSCLFVHYHRKVAQTDGVFSIYINCDEIKSLSYPDLLIRLLIHILEGLPSEQRRLWRLRTRSKKVNAALSRLRELLDLAEDAQVREEQRSSETQGFEASLSASALPAVASTRSTHVTNGRISIFRQRKLEEINRHLLDYKTVLMEALGRSTSKRGALILDDFYLIDPAVQPDVIDCIHRLVRGTNLYLKLGSVRQRTSLVRIGTQTVGIEEHQDVEVINLDHTFEDTSETQEFLESMLDSMADRLGIRAASKRFLSVSGRLELTLASGGVPRDYLTILVAAVAAAKADPNAKWLTPRPIYKGAGRQSYRTKLSHLREDLGFDAAPLERVFQDLLEFCLREKRKTAFLVSQTDVTPFSDIHSLILQLMDFKLIHIIESDTSAASGRSGRYEAYSLDFSLFMEPRLRDIDRVEFWRRDMQHRRAGVREAPVYALKRAAEVGAGLENLRSTEDLLDQIQGENATLA